MIRHELADTLVSLVAGLKAPPTARITIVEADLEVPLEICSGLQDGRLMFYASPPHSRWKAGVLPPVHTGRLRIELADQHGTAAQGETL
jgi:hypothetical protein